MMRKITNAINPRICGVLMAGIAIPCDDSGCQKPIKGIIWGETKMRHPQKVVVMKAKNNSCGELSMCAKCAKLEPIRRAMSVQRIFMKSIDWKERL